MGNGIPISQQKPPFKIHLRHHRAPGDVLVMTACVESLHRTYPGTFLTSVSSSCPAIWENNPLISEFNPSTAQVVNLDYPLDFSQRTGHFMSAFCRSLESALGRPVPLQADRPALYLSEAERAVKLVDGDYWLLNAGYKDDFTTKNWGRENYQRLVDRLAGKVRFVQVGSLKDHHPELSGVLDWRGKTSVRQLFQLAFHAVGGVGPTTFLQHIFAALGRPYVCILGGREPVQWCSYPNQHILHTQGILDCCLTSACWKSQTVQTGGIQQSKLCFLPVLGSEPIPACMDLITFQDVSEKILQIIAR